VLLVVGDAGGALRPEPGRPAVQAAGRLRGHPSVVDQGLPFLTRSSHNIHEITITSDKIKAGPVTITNLDADITNVEAERPPHRGHHRPPGRQALIPFSGLTTRSAARWGDAGGIGDLLGSGVTIKAGPAANKIKANFDLAIITLGHAEGDQGTRRNKIHIQLVSSSAICRPSHRSAEGPDRADPALPLGMKIQRIQVTASASASTHRRQVKFTSSVTAGPAPAKWFVTRTICWCTN